MSHNAEEVLALHVGVRVAVAGSSTLVQSELLQWVTYHSKCHKLTVHGGVLQGSRMNDQGVKGIKAWSTYGVPES